MGSAGEDKKDEEERALDRGLHGNSWVGGRRVPNLRRKSAQ